MPLFTASQAALAEFGGVKLEGVPNIDFPFSSLPSSATPRERNEYITLDRLIRYGASPGCKACENAGGVHNAACKARFTSLIRADKIASEGRQRSPLSPVLVEEAIENVEERADPSSLPFSAGIPPGTEEAMIGKINRQRQGEKVA